jgi:C1A family cysteine protease
LPSIKNLRPHVLPSTGALRKAGGWLPNRPKGSLDWPLSKKLGDKLDAALPDSPHLDFDSFPSIRDQGELGSCTGHGVRNALMPRLVKQKPELWADKYDLSPLSLYYDGRAAIQMTGVDSGAYVRDVIDAARKNGAPREDKWPYVPSRFTREPSAAARETGRWHQAAVGYYRCDEPGQPAERTVDNIVHALANKMAVAFGFTCFDNLGEADGNGFIPLPGARSREEGGHCMCIYGFDSRTRTFWGPNSWSIQWGGAVSIDGRTTSRGYFRLPVDYFLKGLADDATAVDHEPV